MYSLGILDVRVYRKLLSLVSSKMGMKISGFDDLMMRPHSCTVMRWVPPSCPMMPQSMSFRFCPSMSLPTT